MQRPNEMSRFSFFSILLKHPGATTIPNPIFFPFFRPSFLFSFTFLIPREGLGWDPKSPKPPPVA